MLPPLGTVNLPLGTVRMLGTGVVEGVDFGVLLLLLHTESESHEDLNFPAGGLFPSPDGGIERWKPIFGCQPKM